jgi:nucleoid-associated protein YgaU
MVEYDTAGRTILSGRADPGAAVTVAVNMHHVADTKADTEGEWKLTLGEEVPVGRYRLELTGRDADGGEAGDIALEMSRVPPSELGAGGALAVVPGNSLWHLARRSYGDGLRYVELYRANREKIDNPDRIYPGQVLALPDKS